MSVIQKFHCSWYMSFKVELKPTVCKVTDEISVKREIVKWRRKEMVFMEFLYVWEHIWRVTFRICINFVFKVILIKKKQRIWLFKEQGKQSSSLIATKQMITSSGMNWGKTSSKLDSRDNYYIYHGINYVYVTNKFLISHCLTLLYNNYCLV